MKRFPFWAYILFLISFTFFSYAFVDANLIYLKYLYSGFSTQHRILTSIIYIIILVLFFLFYFLFLWMVHQKKLSFNDIKLLIGATVCVLIFSYPAFASYDVFNYVATAKVLFFYRENPYIVMPIEFVGDPFLLFTHAANKIALYGPFWLIVSGVPYILGFGNFVLTLLGYKLFIITYYIGIVFLIWRISKDLQSVVFFALNPLVIIETFISSHNDVVMMFLALFSFHLLTHKKVWIAVIFLIFSILIKYATVFLVPVFLYCIWKSQRKQKLDWQKVFYICFWSMMIIFLLSQLREEIYPWYAIWFLTFASFLLRKKFIFYLSLAFSFGLLLRYIPFMLIGTHFGKTPFIKFILTFLPPFLAMLYLIIKNKLWLKISLR